MVEKKETPVAEPKEVVGVRIFDRPTECATCEEDLDDDPIEFTFKDGSKFCCCDTCGGNLIEMLGVPKSKIKDER